MSEQDTEFDTERAHSKNPDGPLLTVPSDALRNADTADDCDAADEEKTET